MNSKSHFDKVCLGKEKHVIENGKKSNLYYQVVKNLAELCLYSSVL